MFVSNNLDIDVFEIAFDQAIYAIGNQEYSKQKTLSLRANGILTML